MAPQQSPDADAALARLGGALTVLLAGRNYRQPVLVGLHTGGVWVAQRLHARLGAKSELAMLDVRYHRDDAQALGMRPLKAQRMPATLDGRHVVLVDDVLHTGRTVRAALSELFEFGRPGSVSLAVLVERPGRQLPIAPDAVGLRLRLGDEGHVKLHGPQPLRLEVAGAAAADAESGP